MHLRRGTLTDASCGHSCSRSSHSSRNTRCSTGRRRRSRCRRSVRSRTCSGPRPTAGGTRPQVQQAAVMHTSDSRPPGSGFRPGSRGGAFGSVGSASANVRAVAFSVSVDQQGPDQPGSLQVQVGDRQAQAVHGVVAVPPGGGQVGARGDEGVVEALVAVGGQVFDGVQQVGQAAEVAAGLLQGRTVVRAAGQGRGVAEGARRPRPRWGAVSWREGGSGEAFQAGLFRHGRHQWGRGRTGGRPPCPFPPPTSGRPAVPRRAATRRRA